MKDETREWLNYANENIKAAKVLLERNLYNPCLQNVQQGIEKTLKALLLETIHLHRKTHSISELIRILSEYEVVIILNDDDCDLLDSIYLPSKYPLGGVLPDFEPDAALCMHCVLLADEVARQVMLAIEN